LTLEILALMQNDLYLLKRNKNKQIIIDYKKEKLPYLTLVPNLKKYNELDQLNISDIDFRKNPPKKEIFKLLKSKGILVQYD
ncbi:hypothetical protein ACFL2K_04685, partial [Candidatus Margulisiibacteriota bacterium]